MLLFMSQYRHEGERIEICKSMFISSPVEMMGSEEVRRHVEGTDLIGRLVRL